MNLKRALEYVFIFVFFLTGPAVALAGEGQQVVPAVNAELVGTLTESQPKTYVGTVSGAEEVSVVARVSGTLWKAAFREGGMVEKGDVLFEIEDTIYKANVRIAEALIQQAEADLELAIREHERSDNLLRTKAISAQAFDTTLATMELREAKLEEAKANLVLAQQDLQYCQITSPISGRIGEKLYSEGNYITPATGIMATIVQYQPIKVQFSMSESDFFSYFSNHDTLRNVTISIIRANNQPFQGDIRVDFVDNIVDRRTDTIMVHLECDNPNEQLLPGGYIQVLLAEKYETPVPAISTSAVMTDGTNHYVYVIGDDDTVERRNVVLGNLVYRNQIIQSGLEPGERVITGGLNKVRPGIKVAPVMVEK